LPVSEPDVSSSAWTCSRHGAVDPLQPFVRPSAALAQHLAALTEVPMWLPWPLPRGWVVTGLGSAGDDRTGPRATVLACSGPSPVGGAGELLIVAEEPSVGLGSAYAGMSEVDPGSHFDGTAAQAKVEIDGHPTALWLVDGPTDRAVYVGEANGCWLWTVLYPASTGYLLAERLRLVDLRWLGREVEMLPYGALSPRLALGSG
jgi:hypothetical protein